MMELDHILWGSPDLDAGTRLLAELTGVQPRVGGSHPGQGTRNSLISLGTGLYFEVIAPDPAQALEANRGAELAALPGPGVYAFAMRTSDMDGVKKRATAAGVETRGPFSMSRKTPEGGTLSWSIMYFGHKAFEGAPLFVIDWGSTPHPSTTTPTGCSLKTLFALRRDPTELAAAYRALGINVEVKRAARSGFLAILDTPRGELVLRDA